LAITVDSYGETFCGPGSLNIATNEAIVIQMVGGTDFQWYFDDKSIPLYPDEPGNPLAFAGPANLTTSSNNFITFQRLRGTAVKTTVISCNGTNVFNIPAGRTVQFFRLASSSAYNLNSRFQPQGSTNYYPFTYFGAQVIPPSFTGPLTIEISLSPADCPGNAVGIASYFFTDEVLQVPPGGYLQIPAPAMEVNIEKSYNLSNWIPTAAFHTGVEAGAFDRLRMLK
jgi:hypothetical protein